MSMTANLLPTDGTKWTTVNGATVSAGVITIPASNGTTVPKASINLDAAKVAKCDKLSINVTAEFAADYRNYSTLYMGIIIKNAEVTKKYYFPFTTEPKRNVGTNKWLLLSTIDKPYDFSTVTQCTVFFETSTRNRTLSCVIRNPVLKLIIPDTDGSTISDLTNNTELQDILDDYDTITSVNGKIAVVNLAVANLEASKLSVTTFTAEKAEIENLIATKATITSLDAAKAEIGNLLAEKATIADLNAATADIAYLEADNVDIKGRLTASEAAIGDLQADLVTANQLIADTIDTVDLHTQSLSAHSASIDTLEANMINVNTFNAVYADVGTLKSGLIDSTSGQFKSIFASMINTLKISSAFMDIENGFIKNAMIDSLDVNKLNAGDIDTTKIKVASPDGALRIDNNLLTITEAELKRIELGVYASVDAEGNPINKYGFRVRGADGETTLYDETGVHREGITSGAIINEHIGNDTNIAGNKLDVSSIVNVINSSEDSIHSSRIYFDEEEQQLNMFLRDTREVADVAVNVATTVQSGLEDLTATFEESQVYEVDAEGNKISIKSKMATIQQSVDGLKVDVQQTGGNNLLAGSSARLGLDAWVFTNTSTYSSTLTSSRGYFGVDGVTDNWAYLAQHVDTVPGKWYAVMFKYFFYDTGTANFYVDEAAVPLVATAAGTQLNFSKIYQHNFVATGSSTRICFEAFNSMLYIGDPIVIPCTTETFKVTEWQQGPNELISGGISLGAGKMTINGPSGFTGEYTDEYVKYLQRQSDGTFKEKVAFTTDRASFADTRIHGTLGIHRDGTEAGMLSIIPDASGIFFAIND